MAKFFLLSIIIGMIALPTRAARYKTAKLGFKRMIKHVAVFMALYGAGLMIVYGKTGPVNAAYLAFIVLLFRFI